MSVNLLRAGVASLLLMLAGCDGASPWAQAAATPPAEIAAKPRPQAITWNAAASANLDNNANPVFDVPAATTVTHFGVWSASTGGTFYGGDALSDPETFAGQGTYTLSDVDISLA